MCFFSLHISVMRCHRTIWWSHMWPVCFSNFLLLWKQTEVYFLAVVDVPFTPLHVIEKPEDLTRCLARCCSISLVQNDWLYFSCVPLFKCTRVFLCTAVLLIEQFPFIYVTLDLNWKADYDPQLDFRDIGVWSHISLFRLQYDSKSWFRPQHNPNVTRWL